jgi:glutaredoxin/glutathione-dependent peroxiredoxin
LLLCATSVTITGPGCGAPAAAPYRIEETPMTIAIGDTIPACTLKTMGAKGPEDITTDSIFGGKTVLLFAVPGAFTPGCSMTHLPGYVVHADAIKAKGVDTIVCMSVNDAFVMDAWGKAQNAEHLLMLADGNGEFTAKLGLELDGRGFGLGTRSQRFAMLVKDGVVKHLHIEQGPGVDVSSAESMLALL